MEGLKSYQMSLKSEIKARELSQKDRSKQSLGALSKKSPWTNHKTRCTAEGSCSLRAELPSPAPVLFPSYKSLLLVSSLQT